MFSTSGFKKSSANSNSTEKLYLQLRCTGSTVRLTSRTAEPTALAIGLPPNVLKCDAWERVCAIFGVVTTAANGNPLPMPFAIVTEIKYIKKESTFKFSGLIMYLKFAEALANLGGTRDAPARPFVFHFYVTFEEN